MIEGEGDCAAKETTPNLTAIKLLEMDEPDKLAALFQEDTLKWNEIIYD